MAAKKKTSSKRPDMVGQKDLDTLLQATSVDRFDEGDWASPARLPAPGPMDQFRLQLIDNAPQVLATTGTGWPTRSKAATIARAIARADPAVALRNYRGHTMPRRSAGRYETFIQPTPDGTWQIAARHNPDATWPSRKTGHANTTDTTT